MPELAEVEYYRKQWDPGMGNAVQRVLTHPKARIYREIPAAAVRRGLTGRTLVGSRAHGKQMLFTSRCVLSIEYHCSCTSARYGAG